MMDIPDYNQLMRPRKVCLCKSVTQADIKNAVREKGVRNLRQLIKETNATMGCGTCVIDVKSALKQELDAVENPLFHQQ